MQSRVIQSVVGWIGIVGSMVTMGLYGVLFSSNILVNKPNCFFVVPRGATISQLIDQLAEEGYLRYAVTFRWASRLLRYCPSHAVGHYRLRRNMSNWQAIKMLRGAMQYPVKLTLVGAVDSLDLVGQLSKSIGLTKASLWEALSDEAQLAHYGFTSENRMAMFIPDTYEVYWTITPKQLLEKMYRRYQCFWNKARMDQAANLGLTPIEVSILASIVQAETNDVAEAAMIAGVYLNRLKRSMRLESCPTLIYALSMQHGAKVIKRVLEEDAQVISPYNTYRRMGLPPGPLALPSTAMIDAVLSGVVHDYLFFSAKEDFSGLHYFSRTYREHIAHARKYRKVLDKFRVMR